MRLRLTEPVTAAAAKAAISVASAYRIESDGSARRPASYPFGSRWRSNTHRSKPYRPTPDSERRESLAIVRDRWLRALRTLLQAPTLGRSAHQ